MEYFAALEKVYCYVCKIKLTDYVECFGCDKRMCRLCVNFLEQTSCNCGYIFTLPYVKLWADNKTYNKYKKNKYELWTKTVYPGALNLYAQIRKFQQIKYERIRNKNIKKAIKILAEENPDKLQEFKDNNPITDIKRCRGYFCEKIKQGDTDLKYLEKDFVAPKHFQQKKDVDNLKHPEQEDSDAEYFEQEDIEISEKDMKEISEKDTEEIVEEEQEISEKERYIEKNIEEISEQNITNIVLKHNKRRISLEPINTADIKGLDCCNLNKKCFICLKEYDESCCYFSTRKNNTERMTVYLDNNFVKDYEENDNITFVSKYFHYYYFEFKTKTKYNTDSEFYEKDLNEFRNVLIKKYIRLMKRLENHNFKCDSMNDIKNYNNKSDFEKYLVSRGFYQKKIWCI